MGGSKLTDKQERFCQEYIIDLNATQAAIRAGYSEKTAKEIGCENLTKLNIHERVSFLQGKRAQETEITAERVFKDIQFAREIAMGERPQHIVTVTEGIPMSTQLTKTDLSAFIKLTELQMKHLGMFTEKVDLATNASGEINIQIVEDKDDKAT